MAMQLGWKMTDEIVLPKVARNEEITIEEYNVYYPHGKPDEEKITGFYITKDQARVVVEALKNASQLICGEFCSDVNRHSWHEKQDKALAIMIGEK